MEKKITVNDAFQKNYIYYLAEPVGKNFDPGFKPELSPPQMLKMGVFGGQYFHDQPKEFPANWYNNAKLSEAKDPLLNYFKINASQPLKVWQQKGWINEEHDPRGWFQWYCRYYMGRRLDEEDQRQIKRWRQIRRHVAQIKKNCYPEDLDCRRKQRQALLHWAYDSRKI